jgi:predicted dehydrogenase
VVLDLMIHDIDLALALSASEIATVSACGFRVLTRDIDIANARIEFANGCVANLSASRVSQAALRKLRVFQPDLYVSADLQAGKLRYVKQAGGVIEELEETYSGGDALAVQAEAFVGSALHGRAVQVTGEHGRRGLQLALEVGRLVRERLERFG